MRDQPLVHALQALTEEEHHRRFRSLAEPLWIASTLLNLDVAHRRLHEQVEGQPTAFYCPVRQCRKVYILRTALNKHLYKHTEFRRLTDTEQDDVLHEMTFKLPPNCGLRSSVLSTDDVGADGAALVPGQKRPR